MSPASFGEELTFDTVAWWYRTEPCSTSAPVSVLGPWLLPPALTCSMALPLPCVPTRPGLGFFLITSGKLVWGILACRMCADSMCAEAAQKARLPHLRHRSVALVWKGQESCPLSLPVSQLLQACPTHCSPPTLWRRTFIHGTLPCTGLLHCSCGSLPCQDSQDFQGAGLQEAARRGECRGVGTHNSRIIPWPCPSVAHRCPPLHVLVPAGCARLSQAAPPGEPLAVPLHSFLLSPSSLGCDGRATLPVLSGSRLPPFGPPRWDSTACT